MNAAELARYHQHLESAIQHLLLASPRSGMTYRTMQTDIAKYSDVVREQEEALRAVREAMQGLLEAGTLLATAANDTEDITARAAWDAAVEQAREAGVA